MRIPSEGKQKLIASKIVAFVYTHVYLNGTVSAIKLHKLQIFAAKERQTA